MWSEAMDGKYQDYRLSVDRTDDPVAAVEDHLVNLAAGMTSAGSRAGVLAQKEITVALMRAQQILCEVGNYDHSAAFTISMGLNAASIVTAAGLVCPPDMLTELAEHVVGIFSTELPAAAGRCAASAEAEG
jgi:glutaminase